MDVVEAGDESEWDFPPFSGEIDGDKLYGRGTTDMKSGLAALAIAMCELKEEGTDLNGRIRFLATVGEEIGRIGSKQLFKEGYADDIDGLIIAEPSSSIIAYTHIADFVLHFNDAMDKVVNEYENSELGRVAASVTVINGGDQVNSIPARATIEGNIRTIPEFPNAEVKKVIDNILDELNQKEDYNLSITYDVDDNAVEKAKDSSLVQIFDKLTADDVKPGGISPVTDAEAFASMDKDFDLVIYGPGEENLPHQLNEYVSVEDYLSKIDLFKEAIKEYLK